MSVYQIPRPPIPPDRPIRHKPFDFRPKPPYPAKPTRKPKSPDLGRAAMTMAAGFFCRDGIVLCADSEMTYAEALKVSESKMLVYASSDSPYSYTMTGAGHWDYVRSVHQKVSRRLQEKGQDAILDDVLEDALVEMYGTHIALAPEPKPDFSIIVAASRTGESPTLIRSQNTTLVTSVRFECVGIGSILGRYLADSFYRPDISIAQGIALAVYVTQVAKKYVPNCGGFTDVAVLGKDGMEWDFEREIVALETYFSNAHYEIGRVLFQCPNEEINDEEFNDDLALFCDRMKFLRKQKRIFPAGLWRDDKPEPER